MNARYDLYRSRYRNHHRSTTTFFAKLAAVFLALGGLITIWALLDKVVVNSNPPPIDVLTEEDWEEIKEVQAEMKRLLKEEN